MQSGVIGRKASLRDAYVRRLREEGKRYGWGRNGKPVTKRPLKKMSRARRHRMRSYFGQTQAFLKRDENRFCEICTRRREHGENIVIQPATEVHHRNGRIGKLLTDERHWLPSCYGCRTWPHEHPREAREMGLLASAVDWNVSRNGKLKQGLSTATEELG